MQPEQEPILSYEIGNSTMQLLPDGIIYFVAIGDMNDEHADQVLAANLEMRKHIQGKVHSLVDMNRAGKSSPYAREMWKKLSNQKESGKVALYGMNPVARVIASFFVGRTQRKNIHFFKNKEDALLWLKE